jgi:uncharacterized protein
MHLKRTLQRYLPQRHAIHSQRSLKLLGDRLHDPLLWHLNRHAVAGGMSVGLFVAFIPIPLQMVLAAIVAIALRVNVPAAVLGAWFTNPLTMAPAFLLSYRIGAFLLRQPTSLTHFEMSFPWLKETLDHVWQPLLLGSLVLGAFCAVLGNILIRVLWRLHLVRHWKARRKRARCTTVAEE